jgi:site-specific recombinase XerD
MQSKELKLANRNVESVALKIAKESPELKDLNLEQLEAVAKIVVTQRLAKEMNDKANVAGIDYKKEKAAFLKSAGKTDSKYTRVAYGEALNCLENFAKRNGINLFLMSYAQADEFIYSLEGSPNSKRLVVATISSFYSFLARRHSSVKNPIRGTRARPTAKSVRELEIPDESEMSVILNSIPELEKVAVFVMAYRGLRVGALNGLKVWGGKYQSYSKGKDIYGEFSTDVIETIKNGVCDSKTPFKGLTTNAIKLKVYRASKKLYEAGLIRSAYSAHDFRHYFAVSEYKKDRDIYKLSKLLDHSNILVTQTYLRTLRLEG